MIHLLYYICTFRLRFVATKQTPITLFTWIFRLKLPKLYNTFFTQLLMLPKSSEIVHAVPQQILATNYSFWLVNKLLRKIHNSSKKVMKIDKNKFFDEKQQENSQKVYINIKWYTLLRNRPTDPWCDMLQTLETTKKI